MRTEYQILLYQTSSGVRPFNDWLDNLRRRDRAAAAAIDARLARVRDKGNFGDHKPAGHPVCELRIHLGPGYRIYYLLHGQKMIILLVGGEKGDQQRTIAKAQEYAVDFRRRV